VRTRRWLCCVIALLVTACSPAVVPPPESREREQPVSEWKAPVDLPGWRYLFATGDEMRLRSASPDGSSFYMVSNLLGDREHDLLVTVGERIVTSRPPSRRIKVKPPENWMVDLVELPWGTLALALGDVVSPDLQHAALEIGGGLWVADLAGGEVRQVLAGPTERFFVAPRQPLIWVQQPHWSADGQWIYFFTNRRPPHVIELWRVLAAGGEAGPVSGEVLTDTAGVVHPGVPGTSLQKRITTEGFYFREYSPDRQWAAADKTETPTFRVYPLTEGEAHITYTGLPGWYAGPSYNGWAPDSSKLIFHSGPAFDLSRFIGVMDVAAGGTTRLYAFPDPLAGLPVAHGFIGPDQLLVALSPWSADFSQYSSASRQTQWWLLDLKQVPPVEPQEPTRLASAHLFGGPLWSQTGPVTGGETAVAGTEAALVLRFDRPVSPAWLEANLVVEGAGAQLETGAALLGTAAVRIGRGPAGEDVRVRVPAFGFDLLVRRVEPLTAKVEVRQGGGPWEPADGGRVWPREPLDLRFTFNRPVSEADAADAVAEALRRGRYPPEGKSQRVEPTDLRWEGGSLVLHVEKPVPLLVFSLSMVESTDGLSLTAGLRVVRTGELPVLVAAGEKDEKLLTLPVEVTEAVVTPDGRQLRYSAWRPTNDGWGQLYEGPVAYTLDLTTGAVAQGETPKPPSKPATACQLERAGNFRPSPDGKKLLYNHVDPWGPVILFDLVTCALTDLGPGYPAGWDAKGRPLIIRWADSKDRYDPDWRLRPKW